MVLGPGLPFVAVTVKVTSVPDSTVPDGVLVLVKVQGMSCLLQNLTSEFASVMLACWAKTGVAANVTAKKAFERALDLMTNTLLVNISPIQILVVKPEGRLPHCPNRMVLHVPPR